MDTLINIIYGFYITVFTIGFVLVIVTAVSDLNKWLNK